MSPRPVLSSFIGESLIDAFASVTAGATDGSSAYSGFYLGLYVAYALNGLLWAAVLLGAAEILRRRL